MYTCQDLSWLDKHIEAQQENSALINQAASAIEMFNEDELEEHANLLRQLAGMVC